MAKILFCAVDGGAYSALLPVALRCEADGHQIEWVTQVDSVAASKVTRGFAMEDSSETIEVFLYAVNPDIVVAGVSGNGEDIALRLPQIAIGMGIKVVKVIDFWNTGMPHERGFAPTRLCVLDEVSRRIEAKMRGMPIGHVIATGAPQFDSLAEAPPAFDAPPWPFFLLVGPSTKERVDEIFHLLHLAFATLTQKITLGVLWHPKSKPELYRDDVGKMLSQLSHVTYIEDREMRARASTDALLALADLVIGATSTELVKACYLRRPVLSIVPRNGHNHEVITSRGMEMLPISSCGASAHAETSAQVAEFLEVILNSEGRCLETLVLQQKRQTEYYTLDGNNAKRVVDVLESLL